MADYSVRKKALDLIRKAKRIDHYSLADNPGAKTGAHRTQKRHNKAGKSHKELQKAAKPPLGWIFGDWYRPWQRRFPSDSHLNADIYNRREYPPLSLLELQRLVDLGWLDAERPMDLCTLCGTWQYRCDPLQRQFGVQLTDEGADIFAAKVDIEVQWASELAIAAVERNGGRILSAYYDPASLLALSNPLRFFQKGEPIPKRAFPPMDLMPRYVDPKLRGYLADPEEIQKERLELAQKYGYKLPNDNDVPVSPPKDPLQIFHGLEPGWVVNLKNRTVLKPKDPRIIEFYNS